MAVINGTPTSDTIDATHSGTDPFGNPASPSDAADTIHGLSREPIQPFAVVCVLTF
jgi:hypothetical protein